MSASSPLLSFHSNRFPVEPGEDAATNPGLFGRALARWLGTELVPGFDPASLIAEDFGWLVPVPDAPHALYIACVSEDGSSTAWRAWVFAEGGLISRLLGRGRHAEIVAALYARLEQIIEAAPDIEGLREDPA